MGYCPSISSAFIRNYLIGGLVIAIYGTMTDCTKSELAGFVYGLTPMVFIYSLFLLYFTMNASDSSDAAQKYAKGTLIGGLGWFYMIFMTWIFLRAGWSIYMSLLFAFLCVLPLAAGLYMIHTHVFPRD